MPWPDQKPDQPAQESVRLEIDDLTPIEARPVRISKPSVAPPEIERVESDVWTENAVE